jgi:uncharacterized protein (TIGR03437 family)
MVGGYYTNPLKNATKGHLRTFFMLRGTTPRSRQLKLTAFSILLSIGVLSGILLKQSVGFPQISAGRPQARAGHGLVFDTRRQTVLLLNGDHPTASEEGEIWAWNGGAWELIDKSGPSPRTLGGVAYDTKRQVLVLQGGLPGQGDALFGDTREWDGSRWQLSTEGGPGVRNHHVMVYDEARGVTLLFGGQDRDIHLQGDTWTWDGVVWRQVATTGPPARVHHDLVYDKERGVVLLFGGSDGQRTLSDFWEWNGERWREIRQPGPGPRSHHRMAFDAAGGKVHLVGGDSADQRAWTWDGSKWEPFLGLTPSPRLLHALAYDAARKQLILFGGYWGERNLNDTWGLINGQWVRSDAVSTVSAASYRTEVASEAIVAAFGANLVPGTAAATTLPLPTALAGVTVKVRDSGGTERDAPLFFVSPSQINYLVPAGTLSGPATSLIVNNGLAVAAGAVQVSTVAPGLFTANANGQGVAAAVVLRIRADGAQFFEPVARFDAAQNHFIATPIELGPEGDQVFLLLFGTGLRGGSSLAAVTALIGDVSVAVEYAGPQGDFAGLDQVNLRLLRQLAGRGEVNVALLADGKAANLVTVNFR